MATIVPLRLREQVSVRENAQKHLRYLDPSHQWRVWRWIKAKLRKGLPRFERELDVKLRIDLPSGLCIYGAVFVEGVVLVVRIWDGVLTLLSAIHPWRLRRSDRSWDCAVALEKISGHGFMFRVAIAVTAANNLVFECAGHVNGQVLPKGYSLPLCA